MSRVWGLGSTGLLFSALLACACAESETLKHNDAPQGGTAGSGATAGAGQGGSSAQGGSAQGGSAQGGSAQGGSAQGGSATGGTSSAGSAGQGASGSGGSSANGGSSNGGSSGGGSTSGGSAGSANGGNAGQPSGMDPDLGLPDGNGSACSNIGGGCTAADGPGICRIYSQTEGRCESCTSCNNLNQPCTQSSECDILFQCYQGKCIGLCDLNVGCSGVTDWCVNVGNSQYGVCVYPN
ncbi:MAG: hypothetical protein AB7K71_29870 [Polyangiaceae bacterium]